MFTTYFLKCISEDIFRHQEMSHIPYDYYLALSFTEPKLDGSGVIEPSENAGYKRVRIDNSNMFFSEANENNEVLNHSKVYFPESTAPWKGISYYAIFDMPKDGNLLMYGALDKVINVPIKTIISIPVNTLKLTVQNGVTNQ